MAYPEMQTSNSRYHHRPRGPNWFGAGFLVTCGVLAAILVTVLGVYYSRDGWQRYQRSQKESEQAAMVAKAKSFAMPELRKHGIVELGEDAIVREDGMDTVFMATGRDRSNNIRSVWVRFRLATFNGRRHWKLQSVTVESDSPADR